MLGLESRFLNFQETEGERGQNHETGGGGVQMRELGERDLEKGTWGGKRRISQR